MRIATVVLPVPGLPVKLMCNAGAPVLRPARVRSRSTSRSAEMSRMRLFTGASPIRSRSRASSTSLTCESAQFGIECDAVVLQLLCRGVHTAQYRSPSAALVA